MPQDEHFVDIDDQNPPSTSTSNKSNSSVYKLYQSIINPEKRNYTIGELDELLQKQRQKSKDGNSDCNKDKLLAPSRNVVVEYGKGAEFVKNLIFIIISIAIIAILHNVLPNFFPIENIYRNILDFIAYVAALYSIIVVLFELYSSYKNPKSNAKYDFRFLFCFLNYLFA